jgi:predicted NUDIX family NTP pyrophosphohydrolase
VSGTQSAGVLVYRRRTHGLEVLVAHPGGPYWRHRDEGAWSIPKGEFDGAEDPEEAALRELAEETGLEVARDDLVALGSVTLRSGKVVHAWAAEGDLDPADLVSNEFEIEWPPRSGRRVAFPEIDRVAWVVPAEAVRLLNPALGSLVTRLVDHLATSP